MVQLQAYAEGLKDRVLQLEQQHAELEHQRALAVAVAEASVVQLQNKELDMVRMYVYSSYNFYVFTESYVKYVQFYWSLYYNIPL